VKRSSRSSDHRPSFPIIDSRATGVGFWYSIAQGDVSGRSQLIEKLLRFPVPNTFVVDPNQSVTGIVYRDQCVEIIHDISAEAILQFFKFDAVDPQIPIAVMKRPVEDSETATTLLDAQTLTQIVRRIHDSDESTIICIQEYVPSRTAHQFVRVTFNSMRSLCTGVVICPNPSQSVFKLSASALEGDLRNLAESVSSFIEIFFRVHLSQVVFDCIRSSTSSWTLLQVKSITVDRPASSIQHAGMTLSCKARCTICRDNEVSKLVTSRMINDCQKNLACREWGSPALIYRLDLVGSKGSVKCCDECYTLIMNELELRNLSVIFSKKFSTVSRAASDPSQFWRLFVYIQGLANTPPEFVSSGIRITCLDESVDFMTGERKMNFLNISNVLDYACNIVRVSMDGFVGSVDCISTLVARARMSPGDAAFHQTKVYLGKDTFSVSLFVGLCWYKCPLSASQFIPLPDQWVSLVKSRTSRKRSNSRRLSVCL
jgi:hypothetical protein